MSNDDERMVQGIREAGYAAWYRFQPWRPCCLTLPGTDHLADCEYATRPVEPQYGTDEDQRAYAAAAGGPYAADELRAPSYPWYVRAYARLRWLLRL